MQHNKTILHFNEIEKILQKENKKTLPYRL